MPKVDIKDAAAHLEELAEEAAHGQDVVITRGDGVRFQLVPLPPEVPKPIFGSAKGLVEVGNDFDEPLEGFEGV